MSFQGLQDRLSALQETTAQLRDLVDRLASLRFQPGSVPLDVSEEDSVSGELSGEISRLLKQGEEDAELLGEEAEYLRLEEERESVREGVARVERDLKRCDGIACIGAFCILTSGIVIDLLSRGRSSQRRRTWSRLSVKNENSSFSHTPSPQASPYHPWLKTKIPTVTLLQPPSSNPFHPSASTTDPTSTNINSSLRSVKKINTPSEPQRT
jgi:hypothetical protein